jgi:hypothetical protein
MGPLSLHAHELASEKQWQRLELQRMLANESESPCAEDWHGSQQKMEEPATELAQLVDAVRVPRAGAPLESDEQHSGPQVLQFQQGHDVWEKLEYDVPAICVEYAVTQYLQLRVKL